jgi:hypothetical protein
MPELLAEQPSVALFEVPVLEPDMPPGIPFEQAAAAPEPLTLHQRFIASRIGRAVFGGLAALGLASGGVTMAASPAQAESSHTYTVENTNGQGLWLHSDPGFDDANDLIAVVPEGTRVAADCYVHDSPVGEMNNSTWLRVTYNGAEGFIAGAYTGTEQTEPSSVQDKGLELCQSDQPGQPEGQQAGALDFNPAAAVGWAISNARQFQEGGAKSPWFVSNALWQGGLPKTDEWAQQANYWNGSQYYDGIIAAQAPSDLAIYLEEAAFVTREDIGSVGDSIIPAAKAGDVIAYDLQNDGHLDHLAIVVGRAKDNPALVTVAEWGQLESPRSFATLPSGTASPQSPYSYRNWNQLGTDLRPLSEVYPDATAQLLRINAQ